MANNRSAFQHPEFVSQAIWELLENDCIVEHSAPPFCVNPLSVAKGKKLRLVIDLRHVDNFLVRFKFKDEDFCSLSHVLEEADWFFAWDLRSGYHYVDICAEHQTYLGFSWLFEGVPRYFTFAVVPLGLSSACFCFTKLLRPLVKRSRPMSHSRFVHLVIDSVRQLSSCSGRGTLIIPEWPSTSFWPFLRERSSQLNSFVVDMFVLPAITDLTQEGPGQTQIYASRPSVFRGCPKFRTLALRLDFG